MRRKEVEQMLPHRSPFLLVDEITAVDTQRGLAQARRHIDPADPVFAGHFPGVPIYPGVLQLELMGQAGLCLLLLMNPAPPHLPAGAPRSVRMLKIHHAAFLAEVRPGDAVTVLCKCVLSGGLTEIIACQLLRGLTICSVAVAEMYFADE
jgi:3-hydroxymyristoyl/3-hydroxydecanoyl-(acyl carrier protein) dehydratase